MSCEAPADTAEIGPQRGGGRDTPATAYLIEMSYKQELP